jgi:hypothetical protein
MSEYWSWKLKGPQLRLDGRITEGFGREAGQLRVERLSIYLTVSGEPVAHMLHYSLVTS